ncbi:MAG: response regulator [Spirochaetales bacterium]|nr:response regulator [Spirochaetales bacterium]
MNKKVLIVDDEADIRNVLLRQLRKEPIELLFASSGQDALSILETNIIHLVITDQKMPGMSGVDFLRQVKRKWPDVIRLLISGYIETELLINAINKGEVYRFITKPWDAEELKSYIFEGLHHYDVLEENRKMMKKILVSVEDGSKQSGERKPSIQLSDSILEELPFGIIVVNNDGYIIKMNQWAAMLTSVEKCDHSISLDCIFTAEIVSFINNGFSRNDGQDAGRFILNGRNINIRLRSLRKNIDSERGLVIVHE